MSRTYHVKVSYSSSPKLTITVFTLQQIQKTEDVEEEEDKNEGEEEEGEEIKSLLQAKLTRLAILIGYVGQLHSFSKIRDTKVSFENSSNIEQVSILLLTS